MSSLPADLTEDLIQQAEFEFRTALERCGDCTDYHALFGYGRLTRVSNGMTTDGDMIVSLLGRLARPGLRVLIAGAADAGLLALVARGVLACGPQITVADRCATPLAVCRRYAAAREFEIETARMDLSVHAPSGRFDATLAHNVLRYIPKPRHATFLRNLAQSLADGGTIHLVGRVMTPGAGERSFHKLRGDMVAGLTAQGISLPEAEAEFRSRIARLQSSEQVRSANISELPELEENVAAAGLRIRERIDHRKRLTPAGLEDKAQPITTHMFLLSRAE